MKKKNLNIIRIILFTCTFVSLFFVPWPIVWTWLQPLPDTVQEQLEQGIDRGFDGMIVYVDQKEKPAKTYAAGWHNKEEKIPAKTDAYFKIASISKLYFALAITKLVNDGKLSLDASLSSYLPELKGRIENADQITLRLMVQHRSGIPNYTDTYNYWAAPKETAQENLDLVLDFPGTFKPNEDYQYSNTNYLLLGLIIERITGNDVSNFIKDEILIPNGLNNTFSGIHEVDIDDVMSGYYVGYDGDLKYDKQGMIATAEDVGKFIRALNEGSIFEDGEQEIYSSIYVYNHTGLIPGYQSIAKYHKDIDAVIVQFVNTVNFNGYEWNISEVVYNRIKKIVKKNSTN